MGAKIYKCFCFTQFPFSVFWLFQFQTTWYRVYTWARLAYLESSYFVFSTHIHSLFWVPIPTHTNDQYKCTCMYPFQKFLYHCIPTQKSWQKYLYLCVPTKKTEPMLLHNKNCCAFIYPWMSWLSGYPIPSVNLAL